MSDKLNLNCWLLGDDPRRFFPVEIAKTKTIGALKEAIKEGPSSKGDFDGIDAQYLDLWKVIDWHFRSDTLILTISYYARSISISRRTRSCSRRSRWTAIFRVAENWSRRNSASSISSRKKHCGPGMRCRKSSRSPLF